MTLKFDGWPWKTIAHLSYATSNFVHHFKAISEFKLELQSGNAQFGSKSTILFSRDLEIRRMTLKNNRAPLLSNIKLCASFQHHMWIQTGVTVRKRLNGVMTSVTLTFCMDIRSVKGNNSWKFQDDTMTRTLSKRCDGRTVGRMDRQKEGGQDTSACKISGHSLHAFYGYCREPQIWPVSMWHQTKENQQTMTIILSVLKVVKIHQHVKIQAIPSMRSPANALKPLWTDGQTDGQTDGHVIKQWWLVGWTNGPMYRWKEGISGFGRTDGWTTRKHNASGA